MTEPLVGQLELPFNVECAQCWAENGKHAYWCPQRRVYATDRMQGS